MKTRHPDTQNVVVRGIRRLAWLGGLGLVLVGSTACAALRENIPTPTPAPASLMHVTADQIAQAMHEDHFYSDYGNNVLVILGTVLSVNQQNNDLTVTLNTTPPTGVVCDLGKSTTLLEAGDAVTVTARADQALREPDAVLLKNCSIP